jgi:dimeric dUTPase (all-alpha-NTP-PPase superfamily)
MGVLEIMWEEQKKLNSVIFSRNGIKGTWDPENWSDEKRDTWLQAFTTAMSQELAELQDCTNWKWWRSRVDLYDPQNALVELVDILHFWISAAQVLGLEVEDVFVAYSEKNKVNHFRQRAGYVKKTDDCKHIGSKVIGKIMEQALSNPKLVANQIDLAIGKPLRKRRGKKV